MPVLGVCGASYFAATPNLKRSDCYGSAGKHFTEIVAKRLGYDYYTLARSTLSNSAIRLQVDEMIRRRVDFVIFGNVPTGRIEFPFKGQFDPALGIFNFNYRNYPDLAGFNPNFVHNNTVSESINNLIKDDGSVSKNHSAFVTDKQFNALKLYISYLYDYEFQRCHDLWITESAISALRDSNIPYLFFPHWVSVHFTPVTDVHSESDICSTDHSLYLSEPDIRIVKDKKLGPYQYHANVGRRYHTTDENQVIIADQVYNFIAQHNLLEYKE